MTSGADRFADHLHGRVGAAAAAPPHLRMRVEETFGPSGFTTLLAPDSPDGVAAVLAECTAEGWPAMALGAGTWLPPDRVHRASRATPGPEGTQDLRTPVLVSTVRLDRVVEHEPADLVIGVGAGLALERLNAVLTAQQQWLPLDPPAAPEATIGAIAALADSGPLRAGHGTPRDMALGVEIATGDGRLLRFGGRVVKNVAGYDGVRLAIGSRGSLGILTGIYLRVRGSPRVDRTLALTTGTGEDGARRGAELALAIRDRVTCDALEQVSPGAVERLARDPAGGVLLPASGGRGWLLLVRLLGGDAAVAEAAERVRQFAAGGTSRGGSRTVGGPGAPIGAAGPDGGVIDLPPKIWTALARLEAGATTSLRMTGSVAALADGLAAVSRTASPASDSHAWLCAAHAADGVIRVWRTDEGPGTAARADFVAQLSEQRGTQGWTVRYDRIAAAMTESADRPDQDTSAVAGTHTEAIRVLTDRLRTVFDPAGVLGRRTEA